MNKANKIARDAKSILVNSIMDTVVKNVTDISVINSLELDNAKAETLIKVIKLSIDEGYQRSVSSFQNTIKEHIET